MLSLTALVIGSMVPDFEYFIRMKVWSVYSHTWSGLFWFDLPLGLLLMFVYALVIKDKLIQHLPNWLNKRFSSLQNSNSHKWPYYFVVVPLSILIGAATHILWDSFTHPAGYFVKHHYVLRHKIEVVGHNVQFYNILQHASSIVGALIIIYTIYKLPAVTTTTVERRQVIYFWIKMVTVAIAVVLIRIAAGLDLHQYGGIAISFISGLFIGLIITSIVTPIASAKLRV